VDEFTIDLVLEDVVEADGRFVFTAYSITKDFICEKGLKRLSNDSPGKHLVWRHEHPLIPKFKTTHIYGTVLESHIEEDKIRSKYEVYGHTDEHLKARQVIKKRHELGKPISISMRYRQYGEENPIHYDVVEHSLTPTPACVECVALDILNESDKMTKDEELAKEVQKLEEELTKKDKILENLESKVVAIEKELEKTETESKIKDKKLEEAETNKSKITEQLLEFKDKLNGQAKIIEKLQEDNKMKEIEPLINSLVELDGKEMEPFYRNHALNAYHKSKLEKNDKILEEALEFLKSRSKRLEGATHSVVTPLEVTAANAMQDKELENESQRKSRDNRAFTNMPPEFFEWRKRRGDK